jgi:hypothetical protein
MTHEEYTLSLHHQASQAPSVEWQLVFYFYAVVHAVNHALYGGVDVAWSHDHIKRELEMDSHKTLRTLLFKYRALRRDSEVARYKPWLHPMSNNKLSYASAVSREILAACGLVV